MRNLKLIAVHAAAAKSLQSCPTLCDPVDSSSPGSPVPGVLQARTLEWVIAVYTSYQTMMYIMNTGGLHKSKDFLAPVRESD